MPSWAVHGLFQVECQNLQTAPSLTKTHSKAHCSVSINQNSTVVSWPSGRKTIISKVFSQNPTIEVGTVSVSTFREETEVDNTSTVELGSRTVER